METKQQNFNYCEAFVNSSDDAIISKDMNGIVLSWNHAAEKMFGYASHEIIGKPIVTLFPQDKLDEEKLIIDRIKSGKNIEHYETVRLHKNGSLVYVSVCLSPVYDDCQNIVGVAKIARNISEKIKLNIKIDELNRCLSHYQSIIKSSDDAIISKDLKGIITSWNEGATNLFGYTERDMLGKPLLSIFPEDKVDEEKAILERISMGERVEHYNTVRKHKNGSLINVSVTVSPIFDVENRVIGASKIARNITHQIKEQERIKFQANHDSLTLLPNRKYFLDSLELSISNAKLQKTQLAVAIIDLDFFKEINDKFGHRNGDQVLIMVANVLFSFVNKSNFVARMGGDEFVIIINHFKHFFEAEVILKKLLSAFNEIKEVNSNKINLSASIGVSVFPNDADTPEELILKSDHALYEAKYSGKNQFKLFTKEFEKKALRKIAYTNEVFKAFESNQFYLIYQPIIDLKTGKCEKIEALSRWKHPEFGEVPPTDFINIIEEMDLIMPFTDWVINEVVLQKRKLDMLYSQDFQVSINISPSQLSSNKFSTLKWEMLFKQNFIKPSSIIFEITESSLINNLSIVNQNIAAVKAIGIKIAIDDFGTGYSSLSYLHSLNIDFIKIDKSFVNLIDSNQSDSVLCDVIISMAHRLKLLVIAEGVENEMQLEYLKNHGCDFVQGFYFSKPMEINRLLMDKTNLQLNSKN